MMLTYVSYAWASKELTDRMARNDAGVRLGVDRD